ncbi:uncharacterized protein LOC108279237 isoform X2 [Ictalurus punctatus]|uniref:Uncharacterized protein LOC108279237 isoform X2 n=1 Tax=Ictalurus punctatus TaxID=7998 RepID=A0A979FD79_ICTPU|nr:uncharacterized protein LOC108279237 isoform X2 [Ictalurus punctatus]
MAESRKTSSEMTDAQLIQQLALLGWLNTDSVECKQFLTAVTGMQLAREVLNRLSGQGKVDAYRGRAGSRVCPERLHPECGGFREEEPQSL